MGSIRRSVYLGIKRVDQHFKLTVTARNIIRMARMRNQLPHGAAPMYRSNGRKADSGTQTPVYWAPRVRDPNRQGSVASAISHTYATALKGRRFESLPEQNDFLVRWISASTFRKTLHMIKRRLDLLINLPASKLGKSVLQGAARDLASN